MVEITKLEYNEGLCEVVDSRNKLFMIMNKEDVTKQNLISRKIALLLKDLSGHGIFGLSQNGTLTVPYENYLPVGQANSDFAIKVLNDTFNAKTNHVVQLAKIEPNDNYPHFTTVLGMVVSGDKLQEKASLDKNYLWLTPIEFKGLTQLLPEEWNLLSYLYEEKILKQFMGA